MVSTIQILLFIINILAGFLIAYFTYSIYRRTEGGSRAWGYLAITGTLLGLYSVLSSFNIMMGINASENMGKMFIDAIMYGGIAVTFPLSILMLADDMKIKKPDIMTMNKMRIYFTTVLIVLFVYNFILTTPPNLLGEFVSLSMSMIIFTSLPLIYLSFLMAKQTKLFAWKIVMLGTISLLIASGMEQVSSNACNGWDYNDVIGGYIPQGVIGIPECAGFQSDIMFSVIVPTGGITNPLMALVGLNDIAWILAGLFNLIAFFLIWRSMGSSKSI